MSFLLKLLIAFLVLGGGVLATLILLRDRRRRAIQQLKLKLYELHFPRKRQEGRDLAQDIGVTEQLLRSLTSFKEPVVFEAAVPHIGEEISFYVAVSARDSSAFLRQVHSL